MKLPISLLFVLAFSGCAGTTDIDLSKVEYTCGQSCSTSYQTCDSRLTMMPIRQHNDCTDVYRKCVQSCPSTFSSPRPSENTKPSVTDRLKELDALHKSGVIDDAEYQNKRHEILQAL